MACNPLNGVFCLPEAGRAKRRASCSAQPAKEAALPHLGDGRALRGRHNDVVRWCMFYTRPVGQNLVRTLFFLIVFACLACTALTAQQSGSSPQKFRQVQAPRWTTPTKSLSQSHFSAPSAHRTQKLEHSIPASSVSDMTKAWSTSGRELDQIERTSMLQSKANTSESKAATRVKATPLAEHSSPPINFSYKDTRTGHGSYQGPEH